MEFASQVLDRGVTFCIGVTRSRVRVLGFRVQNKSLS